MRICLASIHPRMLSGQIENLVALGRELKEIGHEVQVVSAFAEETLFNDARWTRELGDRHSLLGKMTRIGRVVRRICAVAADADVVHVNLPTPAFAIVGDVVRALTHRPVVVGYEAHLSDPLELLSEGHLRQAPAFYAPRIVVNNSLVARVSAWSATRYVVSSQLQRNELLGLGLPATQVTAIPMPVDTTKLQHHPKEVARHSLGLPLEAPLVAYVGHYHPVKGVEVLPAALRRLQRTVPDARLVLAWSGIGDRSAVDTAINAAGVRDSVIELGRVDPGELFSAADVVAAPYVLTIGQAAYPAVPLEAMQLGKPLVTSDLPLLRELTGNGQAAALAQPGSPESVARALVSLLCDPQRVAEMVAAQQRLMRGAYHPRMVARRYERLYRDAIREAGPAGQADVLQPAGSERGLRPAALRQPERRTSQPARAADGRAAA